MVNLIQNNTRLWILLGALSFLFSCATNRINIRQVDELLISDIDDTIKITHVNGPFTEVIKNGFNLSNSFYGMSDLYQVLKNQNPEIEFIYLSGSPSFMEKKYVNFITLNHFPEGMLIQRTNLFSSSMDFKILKIEELIQKWNPKKIIFIGDNGEKDPDVIAFIQKKYPAIEFHSFIRLAYKKNTKDENLYSYFVTSFDIAWNLFQFKYLNLQELNLIKNDVLNQAAAEASENFSSNKAKNKDQKILFPKWLNCYDYSSDWFEQKNKFSDFLNLSDLYNKMCQ